MKNVLFIAFLMKVMIAHFDILLWDIFCYVPLCFWKRNVILIIIQKGRCSTEMTKTVSIGKTGFCESEKTEQFLY